MTANEDISLCVTSLPNIYFGIEAGWGGGWIPSVPILDKDHYPRVIALMRATGSIHQGFNT